MKTENGNNGIRRHTHFSTLTELTQFALANRSKDEMSSYDDRPGLSADWLAWIGGTLTQAIAVARNGWPEGSQKAMQTAERLTARVLESRRIHLETVMESDVYGAGFDVGTFLTGAPECWMRPEMQEQKRVVNIAYSIDASGAIGPEILANRGAAVMALASILQASGHPVNITAYETDGAKNHCLTLTVLDASSGSVPDYDRIAFVLMHASMLRRFDQIVVNAIMGPSFWGKQRPGDLVVSPECYDIILGAATSLDKARWQNGGEDWILGEYERFVDQSHA